MHAILWTYYTCHMHVEIAVKHTNYHIITTKLTGIAKWPSIMSHHYAASLCHRLSDPCCKKLIVFCENRWTIQDGAREEGATSDETVKFRSFLPLFCTRHVTLHRGNLMQGLCVWFKEAWSLSVENTFQCSSERGLVLTSDVMFKTQTHTVEGGSSTILQLI